MKIIETDRKTVVVINGKGGVGKDTLYSFVAEKYKTTNISSITLIKQIAKIIGWNGEKDNKSRKLLSDLKNIATEYNDSPNKYLIDEYKKFMGSDNNILFVHIREKEQIENFISSVNCNVVTLLIRRTCGNSLYGNKSDDEVELYNYDFVYDNNKPLDDAKDDFLNFFDRNILQQQIVN